MTHHIPVLLQEVLEYLDIEKGEIFLDGTLGGGGHTTRVLEQVPGVRVIALDQDSRAITKFSHFVKTTWDKQETRPDIELINANFRNLDQILSQIKVTGIDAILLDLGISSDQLDTQDVEGSTNRGFSFQTDAPLDMRMSGGGITARDILNTFSEEALEIIIRGFGEERYSQRIAKEIVERRESQPFRTTFDLRDAVFSATPAVYKRGRINPATRTFQAIRIAVNEELTALEEGLEKGFRALNPGGKMVIISFHSLEDRIVKNFFRQVAEQGLAKLITKKPITPTETEMAENPRARSAKMRVIEKI